VVDLLAASLRRLRGPMPIPGAVCFPGAAGHCLGIGEIGKVAEEAEPDANLESNGEHFRVAAFRSTPMNAFDIDKRVRFQRMRSILRVTSTLWRVFNIDEVFKIEEEFVC
jgi:hypothetical protein